MRSHTEGGGRLETGTRSQWNAPREIGGKQDSLTHLDGSMPENVATDSSGPRGRTRNGGG